MVKFVTLILGSNQEFLELRFIDTVFRGEPASDLRFLLAKYRDPVTKLPDVVTR